MMVLHNLLGGILVGFGIAMMKYAMGPSLVLNFIYAAIPMIIGIILGLLTQILM